MDLSGQNTAVRNDVPHPVNSNERTRFWRTQRTRLWETESALALKHILPEYFCRCPASADRQTDRDRARQDARTDTDHWAKARTNRAVAAIMDTALL